MNGRPASTFPPRKAGREWKWHLAVLVQLIALVPGMLYAQSKVRGVSPAGPIGYSRTSDEADPSKIVCTVEFDDPSGDRILSEGETGSITVYVRNYHESLTVQPRLELLIQAGREMDPVFSMEPMGKIPPGKLAFFKKEITWHDRLPPGTVTVRVRILDTRLRFESGSIQMRFNVRNPAVVMDPREYRWNAKKQVE